MDFVNEKKKEKENKQLSNNTLVNIIYNTN